MEFRAEHYYCALRPVERHISFWIFNNGSIADSQDVYLGRGRASYVRLRTLDDVDGILEDLVTQACRTEGLRPLKRPRRRATS